VLVNEQKARNDRTKITGESNTHQCGSFLWHVVHWIAANSVDHSPSWQADSHSPR